MVGGEIGYARIGLPSVQFMSWSIDVALHDLEESSQSTQQLESTSNGGSKYRAERHGNINTTGRSMIMSSPLYSLIVMASVEAINVTCACGLVDDDDDDKHGLSIQ